MKKQIDKTTTPFKRFSVLIGKVDQNIEKWMYHFIRQIDGEAYTSQENHHSINR